MKILLYALVALIFSTAKTIGQSDESRQKNYNIRKAAAIEGYDPVSYFDGTPVEGNTELKFTYRGVPYLFVNTANLGKFKASPEKYEPAYGGWCAYAMGEKGEKVKIDPETFKIIDGKVYLFYNFWGTNTLTDWNQNETVLKSGADKHWKKYIP